MNGTNLSERENRAGASLWLSLWAAPLIPAAGYLAGWNVSDIEIVLLSMLLFVAALFSGHEGRLPFTEIRVAPKHAIIFWGVLSLGVTGGMLVAVVAAFAGLSAYRGRRLVWAKVAAVDLISAAAAGAAFTAALDFFRSAGLMQSSVNALVSNEILATSAVMLIAYQISGLVFGLLLLGRAHRNLFSSGKFFAPCRDIVGPVLTLMVAIVMYAAFQHFGNTFGLVVVPLTLLANLAYEIHLRRLEQKTKEIADASRLHLATVEALATAIDARDQVGVGHVRRTQIYAVGIGTALGLCDGDLNALRAGALLHDIGKLAVPEHILNKPGRLTSAELEKTKIHAAVGASILGKVGFPYPVVPTVRHHHEFWDGSGYPDGLSGDRIPLTARILSVADAFDALRGPRPFRSAVSREDACSYLRSRAGTQFDPHVVNTFLRNMRELEAEVEIHGLGYEKETFDSEQNAAGGSPSYVEQIKRANQEVFSLYEMARDFGGSLNLDQTFDLLTRKVSEFVPYDTCLVYLLDEDGEHATAAHVEGRNREALLGKQIVAGEGASGYVLKKRKPVENVDPSLDFAFSHPEICEHYLGMACVPLLAEEKLIGAVAVFTGELAMYEEEHLRLLETISRIAADAISKSIKQAKTEVHAQTDALTGLPNARGLQMQFEKEIGRARRSGNSLQVLMLDLDGFKNVNDMHGHKVGDTVLTDIGGIIKSELRDYDFLARYGGDEFVALIPETDSADVIELCSRIEAAVGTYASSVGSAATVGVSVGAASFPAQGEGFEELLIAADKAMYRTKAFHKQRLERLVENAVPGRLYEIDHLHDSYAPNVAAMEFGRENEIGNGLVVELDESHIVMVNTIN